MGERTVVVTRYECRVHARNLHAGYGVPVTVYADSKQDAINKAVAVGWNGYPNDARVTVDKVAQEVVVLPATPADQPTPSSPARGEKPEES